MIPVTVTTPIAKLRYRKSNKSLYGKTGMKFIIDSAVTADHSILAIVMQATYDSFSSVCQ